MNRSRQGIYFEPLRCKIHRVVAESFPFEVASINVRNMLISWSYTVQYTYTRMNLGAGLRRRRNLPRLPRTDTFEGFGGAVPDPRSDSGHEYLLDEYETQAIPGWLCVTLEIKDLSGLRSKLQSSTVWKSVQLNLWRTASRVRGFKGFT